MTTPLVSICIPAYNAEPYIETTIDSALNQTYSNIEIIVIDDGSSDRTLELASRYKARGVSVIHQQNKGASAARNVGLRAASGEWIQFLDADDVLHPEKIERQIRFSAEHGTDFLYGAEWARFIQDVDEAIFMESHYPKDCDAVTWLTEKYSHRGTVPPIAWLAHRSLIEKAGEWDERLSLNDDGEFYDRLVLHSQGIRHVAGAKAYYRSQVMHSLSGRVSRPAAESGLLAMDLCTARLLQAENTPVTRHACAMQYMQYAYQFYPIERDLAERAILQVNVLGGTDWPIPGSPSLKLLARLIGWRSARLMQYRYYRWRYNKT